MCLARPAQEQAKPDENAEDEQVAELEDRLRHGAAGQGSQIATEVESSPHHLDGGHVTAHDQTDGQRCSCEPQTTMQPTDAQRRSLTAHRNITGVGD